MLSDVVECSFMPKGTACVLSDTGLPGA
jgi:hypothetical protein